ncbi:MAG: hypothetical protein IJB68_10070 [Ruminococcus sp.]|nr:hypothetical protein [Ruminococcus sp.]
MKSTIDFLFKDVSDNKDGKELFGFSAQTVKKRINDIEHNYFEGRKIYHGLSKSKNNAIIFRCEIKGLLLLLLKLELEDVFRDDKSKKSGVTIGNIDRIIDSYVFALDEELLSDYEYRVLMQFTDIDDGFTFLESIKAFRNELSKSLIILATKYHDHAANYFKMFIKRIRDISVSMIYGSYDLKQLNSSLLLQPLDLKIALIRAINQICDDLYYFKEDMICRRRINLLDNKQLSEEYNNIRNKHLCIKENRVDDQRELTSDEFQHDELDIIDIRDELTSLLCKYYEQKYPHVPVITSTPPTKENIVDMLSKTEKGLYRYIELFIKMQKLCYGKLSEDECEEIYTYEPFLREFYNTRFQLLHTEIHDWSFANYLPQVETYLTRQIKKDALTNIDQINEIIKTTMDRCRADVMKRIQIIATEMNKYDNKELLEIEYSGIIDNIEEIEATCESLAKNLIAMILKQEADRNKEPKPY